MLPIEARFLCDKSDVFGAAGKETPLQHIWARFYSVDEKINKNVNRWLRYVQPGQCLHEQPTGLTELTAHCELTFRNLASYIWDGRKITL